MRRRSDDVFELGEEQLLDEPAVELSDAEDPPAPHPYGGGPADEERGPEGTAVGMADPARPPILAAIRGRGATGVGAALAAVAMAALVLTQVSPGVKSGDRPEATTGDQEAPPRISGPRSRHAREVKRVAARGRGSGRSQRAERRTVAKHSAVTGRREVPDETQRPPKAVAPAEPPATPAPAPELAPVPEAPAAMSRGEIFAREFGP